MALTNAQFDAIMRIYNERQLLAHREAEERKAAAYKKIPRLPEIDEEIADLSMKKAMALLGESDGRSVDLEKEIADRADERRALLQLNGLPVDYLDPHYTCDHCRDTGFIGTDKCSCFKQLEINQLYKQSNLQEVLRNDSFDHFSMNYYSTESGDDYNGLSPADFAGDALQNAKSFVADFDKTYNNLFITGNVGIGKTFLTHCIAGSLLETGHSVLYLTAYDLFELLGKYTFESDQELREAHASIFECDLLIVDDLGTEMTNTFTVSQLFLVLNERALLKKPIVISSNLSMQEIVESYTERISSRIKGDYTLIQMVGTDIRSQLN